MLFLTSLIIEFMSVVIDERVPVTPSDETQYKNPSAFSAIMEIRSWEVGAIIEIRSRPYFLQRPSNSSFSSKGISGSIRPSMPISLHLEIKISEFPF